ncbi:VWA domain-containing protein [Granulicella sp. WH15]|uniref:VWA domain-containing protein n=1 Tax=Granulicella sp. WH15 TaxID=2602070 RepID=UPI001366B99C|nr:VWA domain-containing protein [Granulicella sp. WH15]QHN05629.1 VWA domain-containing protein [Granulicella sp. WH15]
MRFTICAIAAIVLSARLSCAQQLGTNEVQGKDTTYTLSVKSQLVTEVVVVKDKQGKFVSGLSAKDFEVTEDGTPQTVRVFERESLPVDAAPLPITSQEEENVRIYKRLGRTSYAATGKENYKDRRLLALYFDMTAMRPDDQVRALQAAEKFVRTQMTEVDMLSILRYQGGSVDVLLDFSSDRNKMLSILETMVVGEGQGSAEGVDDSSSTDEGAAFGQDASEFNIFNTDRQLSALQTTAHMLEQINEKKTLLYFSSGLRLNGNDNQAQLHATVDAAVKAGVAFWPVDARGLVAQAPLGDATQGSPGNAGMYNGTAVQAGNDRFQQSQDTLYSLAADTGGKAFFDNNDLASGIVRAQRATSDYYLVGYYTTNTAQNGHFRRIKITLPGRGDASLDYRQGYYANKEFGKFNEAEKERQLEDALLLGDPITELTVAMEINYFQMNRAEYFVPITVKIPGRELALAKHFGNEHTVIDFVCEIKDEMGITTSNLRDNVDVKLNDASVAELARRPIEYSTGFTLLPGHYTIKFLARDNETGRIGTFQTTFVVPNLNKELKRLPISSVVLSSQRVDTKQALFNTMKGKEQAKNDAVNPLVNGGGKLIPSVTRAFHGDRELEVFLQAYMGGTDAASSPQQAARAQVVAFVSFYRNGSKVMQSDLVQAVALPESRLGVVPINLKVSLEALEAGEYQCQVTVLDPAKNRAAFWQGSVAVVR